MAARPDDLRGCSLLAVFAHPDDESLACGGLLARCADLGAQVSLLCLTHGEHGPREDLGEARACPACPERASASRRERALASRRARELREASRVLGIADLMLLHHEDGMLRWVDAGQLEADIHAAIRRFSPHVVITFDEDGLYWHPDHIAVHERTTAAVAAMCEDGPALYYVTMPPGSMRAVVEHAQEMFASRGLDRQSPLRVLGIADPDAFGALAAAPTLIVETADVASRKLAAIRCHHSQLADDALTFVSESDAARLLRVEHYRRAQVGSRGATFIDRFARSDQI